MGWQDAPEVKPKWQDAPAIGEVNDPSSTGGTLQFGPLDTGIETPVAVDRALSGAGKFMSDIARGAGQIVSAVSPEQVDESNRLDAPLMNTTAGKAGYLGGAIATAVPTMGIGSGLAGAAAVGAGYGALQPTGTNDSRIGNMAAGAVLGGGSVAALRGAGRLFKPIQAGASPVDVKAAKTLESAGVTLDSAQRSGSPALQRIKSGIPDNPLFVDRVAGKQADQLGQYNKAVLSKMGETATAATDDVMGKAYSRIGGEFERILPKYDIRPSPKALWQLRELERSAKRQGAGDAVSNIASDIRDELANNGGKMSGKFYQKMRQDVSALEGKPEYAPIARKLREGLDDAFQQTASPTDAKALLEARRQWRNMRIIENAIAKDGSGNISPARLANQFGTKKNRAVGVYGKGDQSVTDLAKLAKAGNRLLTDKTPNSGTATRKLMSQSMIATGVDAAGRVPFYRAIYGDGLTSNYLVNGLPGSNALLEMTRRLEIPVSRTIPAYLLADSSK